MERSPSSFAKSLGRVEQTQQTQCSAAAQARAASRDGAHHREVIAKGQGCHRKHLSGTISFALEREGDFSLLADATGPACTLISRNPSKKAWS
jgi:hypothetical protein